MHLLLRYGAMLETPTLADRETPLHDAAAHGDTAIVDLLLARGAYVDAKNVFGETPLHLACKFGREDIAILLMAAGGSVDIKDDEGLTPLSRAIEKSLDTVIVWYRVHHPEVYEEEAAYRRSLGEPEVRANAAMSP